MRTWDGHYVCKEHKEVRNPQDFVRGVAAEAAIPWRRSNGQTAIPPAPVYGGWFALGVQTQALSGFGTGKWHPRQPQVVSLILADTAATPSESLQRASASTFNFAETATASEAFAVTTTTIVNALDSNSLNTSSLG
jgi:hypothetical protein